MDLLAAIWMLAPAFVLPLAFIRMNCCGVECEHCSGEMPEQIQVDLANFVSDGTFCFECESIDGTYVVTKGESFSAADCDAPPTPGASLCNYGTYDATPTAYDNTHIGSGCGVIILINASTSAGSKVTNVFVEPCAGGADCEEITNSCHCRFQKNYGATPPDCNAFSNTNIPFQLGSLCGGASATCAITSL